MVKSVYTSHKLHVPKKIYLSCPFTQYVHCQERVKLNLYYIPAVWRFSVISTKCNQTEVKCCPDVLVLTLWRIVNYSECWAVSRKSSCNWMNFTAFEYSAKCQLFLQNINLICYMNLKLFCCLYCQRSQKTTTYRPI